VEQGVYFAVFDITEMLGRGKACLSQRHDAEVWTLDAHFKGLAGVVWLER